MASASLSLHPLPYHPTVQHLHYGPHTLHPTNIIKLTDLPSDILIHIASFLDDDDDDDDDGPYITLSE